MIVSVLTDNVSKIEAVSVSEKSVSIKLGATAQTTDFISHKMRRMP